MFCVVIAASVSVLVVYRRVFVPPKVVTPVPPFATDRVPEESTPSASVCTAPAPNPESIISPVVFPPRVRLLLRSDCIEELSASKTNPFPVDPEMVATGVSDATPVIAN